MGGVDLARVHAARAALGDAVLRTPVLSSRVASRIAGGPVLLKAENLQHTGSFKLRGALARVAALGDDAARGVVAGSAGNHAQALAYAARRGGIPCEVVMPVAAPVAKVEAAAAYGATVIQAGEGVEDAVAVARERASTTGATFVHPFDDPDVIAGQGTVGLEILEQVDDLGTVVIPVGGGGLAAGAALAIRSARPEVRVIGVQAAACPGVAGAGFAWPPVTLADGIAVKRPSERTAALLGALVDDVVLAGEDAIAEAISLLLHRGKLLVEGAGAVVLAALIEGTLPARRPGATVLVLSGGNIDATTLGAVMRREETRAGRRLVVRVRVADRPGHLAECLTLVGRLGGNLLQVSHIREGVELPVRETDVELTLETRGEAHARDILDAIRHAGYQAARGQVV